MAKTESKGKRDKGKVAGWVRFALNEEELQVLDEACKLDEHCRADLARIYTMRVARSMVAQSNNNKLLSGDVDIEKIMEVFISRMSANFPPLEEKEEKEEEKKKNKK